VQHAKQKGPVMKVESKVIVLLVGLAVESYCIAHDHLDVAGIALIYLTWAMTLPLRGASTAELLAAAGEPARGAR
jgi:hypothetical protein